MTNYLIANKSTLKTWSLTWEIRVLKILMELSLFRIQTKLPNKVIRNLTKHRQFYATLETNAFTFTTLQKTNFCVSWVRAFRSSTRRTCQTCRRWRCWARRCKWCTTRTAVCLSLMRKHKSTLGGFWKNQKLRLTC